jgi:hypothetical protein
MKSSPLGVKPQAPSPYESVGMSIDDAGLDFLMNNLTNLYTEPYKAVLREYTANAIDSHIRANQKNPILVTLPTDYNRFLTIQDFGVGLSKDEITNVYARYGKSTKRDTNTQIGAFGLGCKSALAVADRFDLVAVKDGVKNVVYIQKSASTGVGQVYFVSEEETDEPNGVLVKIPAMANRYYTFSMKEFFMGWTPGSISIDGEVLGAGSLWDEETFHTLKIGRDSVLGWVAHKPSPGSYSTRTIGATIGGIKYNFLDEECNKFPAFGKLKNYYRDIYVNLPMGSVDLTPPREELRYSDLTLRTIETALDALLEALPPVIQAEVDREPTHTAAARRVCSERRGLTVVDTFYYRGEEVPSHIELTPGTWGAVSKNYGTKTAVDANFHVGQINGVSLETWVNENAAIIKVNGPLIDVLERGKKDLKDYLESIDLENGKVYFTTDKRFSNTWIRDNVIDLTFEDFQVAAKEARRTRYAAARASRSENPVVREPNTYVVLHKDVRTNANGKSVFWQAVIKSETDFKKKIAYVHQKESVSTLQQLFPTIRQVNRLRAISISNRDSTWELWDEHFSDYEVLFLPSTRSTALFLKSYPEAVKLETLLIPKAKELVAKSRAQDVDTYALKTFENDYSFKNQLNKAIALYSQLVNSDSPVSLDAIESEKSREMFETVSRFGKEGASSDLRFAFWASYVPTGDQAVTERAAEIRNFVLQYPLLTQFQGILSVATDKSGTTRTLTHLVGYINMVDSL